MPAKLTLFDQFLELVSRETLERLPFGNHCAIHEYTSRIDKRVERAIGAHLKCAEPS